MKKYRIIAATYAVATILSLGAYSFAGSRLMEDYRLAAKYSSARAFEETVSSLNTLDSALKKSLYATDSAMRSRLCSEAFAGALAAETAMATLPFSTIELEQLTAFLNYAGDYAYTLGRQSAQPDAEQLQILSELSSRAGEFSEKLRQLQGSINSGELLMDSLQQPLGNVNENAGAGLLSESLLEYENGLGAFEMPDYEGKYNTVEKSAEGDLDEDGMKALAAEYAGVDVQQLKSEYSYEGESGRKCYSAGDIFICVSPAGVESIGRSRLVGEALIDDAQAQQAAEQYLKDRGLDKLSLSEKTQNGYITVMEYAVNENGIMWPDNYVKIAIAMDDGSVYSFNALNYSQEESGAEWSIDEKEARKAVPASLSIKSAQKLISSSADGKNRGCYRFDCLSEMGEIVSVLVDGKSGKQIDISID